jgi:CRP/FNR family nitrogen fixation transcriptional regulator
MNEFRRPTGSAMILLFQGGIAMHSHPAHARTVSANLAFHSANANISRAPAGVLRPQSQPAQVTCFSAEEEIYAQGEKAGSLYQLEFGVVRIFRLLADGRRQISAFHLAGEIFGFEADTHHHFFAEAVCASGIRVFREPIDPHLAGRILPAAVGNLVRAQEHLLVIGRQSATERLAAFLVDMMDRQGELAQIDLLMSRTDIGDYLGLTIETVSRAVSKLRKAGYIRLDGARSIVILRPDALRRIAE